MNELIEKYLELKKQEMELAAEIEGIKSRVKHYMKELNLEVLETPDGAKISIRWRSKFYYEKDSEIASLDNQIKKLKKKFEKENDPEWTDYIVVNF
jgi:hypothetical protein